MANKDNSGALFKAKPSDVPNRPGYSGSATIDGKEYWISAWVKESDVAGKYFSMSFKPKDQEAQKVAEPKAKPVDDDNEIPF